MRSVDLGMVGRGSGNHFVAHCFDPNSHLRVLGGIAPPPTPPAMQNEKAELRRPPIRRAADIHLQLVLGFIRGSPKASSSAVLLPMGGVLMPLKSLCGSSNAS